MGTQIHVRFMTLMSEVLDGAATPGQRQELDRHLKICDSCSATWREWEALDWILITAPAVVPQCDFAATVGQKLSQIKQQRPASPWTAVALLSTAGLCFGASFLMAMGLFWLGWRHPLAVAMLVSFAARTLGEMGGFLQHAGSLIAGARVASLALLFWVWALCGVTLVLFWSWVVLQGRSGRRSPGDLTNSS
jgi:anti-sigma factor RsiW